MKKLYTKINKFLLSKISTQPLLVAPTVFAWIAISILITLVSSIPIVILIFTGEETDFASKYMYWFYLAHHVATFVLLALIWGYLISVIFKAYWVNMKLDSDRNPIYQSISLVITSIFIFSILIYFAQALTENASFAGIHQIPDNNFMTIIWDPLAGLIQLPPGKTIIDCIYYSYSLITGSGLSVVKPISFVGKIIAMAGVATSIGLITIVLSAAGSRVYAQNSV